jgi:hypothetical protein
MTLLWSFQFGDNCIVPKMPNLSPTWAKVGVVEMETKAEHRERKATARRKLKVVGKSVRLLARLVSEIKKPK